MMGLSKSRGVLYKCFFSEWQGGGSDFSSFFLGFGVRLFSVLGQRALVLAEVVRDPIPPEGSNRLRRCEPRPWQALARCFELVDVWKCEKPEESVKGGCLGGAGGYKFVPQLSGGLLDFMFCFFS